MHKKISNKGQGAIEYLLVIGAVIIVVAVVIIALSGTLNETKQAVDNNAISNMNDPLHNLLKTDFCTNEGEEVCNPDKTYKICTNEKWVSFDANLEHCGVECLEDGCDGIYFKECSNFNFLPPVITAGECGATCEIDGTESCTTELCGEGTKNYTCNNGTKSYTSACIANTPQCSTSTPTCANYLTLQNCSIEKCTTSTTAASGEICITNKFEKKFNSGFGTTSEPYKISNCTQLQAIGFSTLTLDKNFELDRNIDCTSDTPRSIGTCGTGTCADGDENAFKGTLNGNNYSIKAAHITTLNPGHALFSIVKGATIKNITFSQAFISSGYPYIGGFAGYCENSTFENLKNNATVNFTATGVSYAGGICGYATNNVAIRNCVNTGSIKGGKAGGITGQLSSTSPNTLSTIINSYNTGTISTYQGTDRYLGGITGYLSKGSIIKTYNSGTLNSIYSSSTGGIAGYASGTNNTITNSFNVGSITSGGTNRKGGIIGTNNSASVSGAYIFPNTISTCCGQTSCACTISPSIDSFYSHVNETQTHPVYYANPIWDNNWIWSSSALPKLSWE